ncbi:MAG: threonine dehydrogenase-like Zn-dependent dehydrogenase, partial [Verrucomicrobiales bacterium]
MKAIAVKPGTPDSVHLAELDMPLVGDVKNGLGILIKVLKVGVDATDREINDAEYGNAPPGYDFLVLGHELFGIVEEVGPEVRKVKVGDYVTCTVRRAGKTIFDQIGRSDFTSDETYYERGINLLHGYLTEYVVETEEFVIRVPDALKHLHVLPEPMSCAAKAVEQAYEVQRRLKVWEPRLAFVTGSGQIGLLTTMALRLRGLDVYTLARGARADNLKADIV